MKRFLKILIGIIGVILLILIITPFFFKGKVESMVKEEVNNQVLAKVDWSTFSLSLIKDFPDLSVGMSGLSIVGINQFEGDTLLYLKEFSLSADLFSAMGGKGIEIKTILFEQPMVYAKVLADSTANWDIVKPSDDIELEEGVEETEESTFTISLKSFQIRNSVIKYVDQTMDLDTEIKDFNLDLSGDLSASTTNLVLNTSIDEVNISMEKMKYLNKTKVSLTAEILADLTNMIFTFKENELMVNNLGLGFEGSVAMLKEGYDVDVKLAAKKTDFKSLLALVPEEYLEYLEGIETSGTLALEASAKGIYTDADHLPSFKMILKVDDGQIKYPDLPKSIDNINIDVLVENSGGSSDNTIAEIKTFHFGLGSNPFDASLLLKTPVSNAQFKGKMLGVIDLGSLKDAIPLDSFDIKGIIDIDLSLDGDMEMIEKEDYEAVRVKGKMNLSDFFYSSTDLPQDVMINKALLSFTPKAIALESFQSKVGRSDFDLSGKIENYLPYIFKDEIIYGILKHKSQLFDANEFLVADEAETTDAIEDSTSMELFEIPKNIDFVFTSSFNKILYDKLEINNAQGKITIRDGKVVLDGIAMNLLDGEMVMAGEYNTQNVNKPFVDFLFTATSIDIAKTANSFSVIDSLMPIAKKSKGKISASLKYNSLLDKEMAPVIPSITGSGNIKSKSIEVTDSKVLNSMADLLKKDEYRKMKAEDINIDFIMKDGKIIVAPFTTNVFGKNVTVKGEQGFDQSLNYIVRTPISRKEVAGAMSFLGGGFSETGEDIMVDVIVKGTAKDPKLSMDLSEAKKQVQKEVEKEAKKAVEKALENKDVKKTVDDIKKKLGGLFK